MPGGETDGIGKFQAQNFHGQGRRAKTAAARRVNHWRRLAQARP